MKTMTVPFKVVYEYDNIDHIIGIGILEYPYLFGKFAYRPN